MTPLGVLVATCPYIGHALHMLACASFQVARHPCIHATNCATVVSMYCLTCSSSRVRPEVALHEAFCMGGQWNGQDCWRWTSEAVNRVRSLGRGRVKGGLFIWGGLIYGVGLTSSPLRQIWSRLCVCRRLSSKGQGGVRATGGHQRGGLGRGKSQGVHREGPALYHLQ